MIEFELDCRTECTDSERKGEDEGGLGGAGAVPVMAMHDFGDSDSYKGIFRALPFREVSSTEFHRGNYAQGARGVIDPMDPDNPYGPNKKGGFISFPAGKAHGKSGVPSAAVSTVTLSTTANTQNHTMNISQISGISLDADATRLDIKNGDISIFAPEVNPFF